MEKLPGESLNTLRKSLSAQDLDTLREESGAISRRINEISCPRFGIPGQPDYQGREWFPTFRRMLELGVSDADARNIDLRISVNEMFSLLGADQALFTEVTEPRLVHWDSWDGNIFAKDGRITGFIDWERALWADPLMEVGFRTYSSNESFRRGYGLSELTPAERRRALWYDVYLLVLMGLEYEYRKYETADLHEWALGLLGKQLRILAGV